MPLNCSYNRLGKNADEKDAEEIIDMAAKASVVDQQKQVQENVHAQIKVLCAAMGEILLPDSDSIPGLDHSSAMSNSSPRQSGLSLAIGRAPRVSQQPGMQFVELLVIFLFLDVGFLWTLREVDSWAATIFAKADNTNYIQAFYISFMWHAHYRLVSMHLIWLSLQDQDFWLILFTFNVFFSINLSTAHMICFLRCKIL